MPREKSWPTQRFVTKPPAYERQGVTIDDLIDYTPEFRAEAVKLASRFKIGPIFTPPVVSKWPGPLGMLMLPRRDWRRELAGRLVRPRDRDVLFFTNTNIWPPRPVPGSERPNKASDMNYVRGMAVDPRTRRRRLCRRRCRGRRWSSRRTAASARSICTRASCSGRSRTARRRTTCAIIRLLKGLNVPRTGRQGRIGTLITKSL